MPSGLENRALRDQAGGEKAPQRHHQLARQRDDGDALHPFAGARRALTEPAAERAVRLMSQPQPSELDRGMAGTAIAGLADPLLAIGLSAAPRTAAKPEIAADFPAIAEVLVEHLIDQLAREGRAQRLHL